MSAFGEMSGEPNAFRRYRINQEIGRGASAVVYEGEDPLLERRVAIKRLLKDASSNELWVQHATRMLREAGTLGRLQHPGIVQVFATGVLGERVYIVMEYLGGGSLQTWLENERPVAAVTRTFVTLASAIAAAHQAGVIHRDIKPGNVMLTARGEPKLVDFGLARLDDPGLASTTDVDSDAPPSGSESSPGSALSMRLTATGTVMGTPVYMAPEQHFGKPASPESDQFSFFASLLRGLTGRRPFRGSSVPELCERKTKHDFDAAGVPPRLLRVIRRGLSPLPEARFPSMTEAADALRQAARPRLQRPLLGLAAAGSLAAVLVAASPTTPPHPGCAFEPGPAAPAALEADARSVGVEGSGWLTLRDGITELSGSAASIAAEVCSGERPAAALACAEERVAAASALLSTWTAHPDAMLRGAASLESLRVAAASCLPTSPDAAEAPTEVLEGLALAEAGVQGGTWTEADTHARTVLANPGAPPRSVARAHMVRNAAAFARADYKAASESAEAAALSAWRGRAPALAARAVSQQLRSAASAGDAAQVKVLSDRWLAVAGTASADVQTRAALTLCIWERVHGNFEQAARHCDRAERASESANLPLLRAAVLGTRANLLDTIGEYDLAERLSLQALRTAEHTLGPRHPRLAPWLTDHSSFLRSGPDGPARALAVLERASSLIDPAENRDLYLAITINRIDSLRNLDRFPEALELLAQASSLSATTASDRPLRDHELAVVRASLLFASGDPTAAVAASREAIRGLDRDDYPATSRLRLSATVTQANGLLELGQPSVAEAAIAGALAAVEAENHPITAHLLLVRARAVLAMGEPERAYATIQRASERLKAEVPDDTDMLGRIDATRQDICASLPAAHPCAGA